MYCPSAIRGTSHTATRPPVSLEVPTSAVVDTVVTRVTLRRTTVSISGLIGVLVSLSSTDSLFPDPCHPSTTDETVCGGWGGRRGYLG